MQSNRLRKLVLAIGLALAGTAIAAPIVYNESASGTGNLPAGAEAAGAADAGLVINGNLTDGRGGNLPNLADLYSFSVAQSGYFSFDTFGSGIADPQLFLFDNVGSGLFFNNDASIAPSNTQSSFISRLDAGIYYIGFSFYAVDPADAASNPIFDTAGSNEGRAIAGAGPLAQWQDFSGLNLFDVTDYNINIAQVIPEPGALPLALAALGLMAAFARRRPAA